MRFYFRNNALEQLEVLSQQSVVSGKMAVLLGRRRIGKTSLALELVKNKEYVYLFVAKKTEPLLCEGFASELRQQLKLNIHGQIESFVDIFKICLEHAKTKNFTLIIDEFQEFYSINPSVYSEIQNLWDLYKQQSKLNVIFIGSVYSLMHKIFENEKEPLFGRADRIITLRPFSIKQTQSILQDYQIDTLEQLFEFYVVTGCMPKYLDVLLTNKCHDLNTILDFMLQENSPFLHEGRNQLIEEFGKDYMTYFSILELIACGKTSSSEMQSIIQKNVSAYLDKLENTYNIIKKFKPITAKPNSKLVKYYIVDNFLKFWFGFFHRYRDAIEIRNFEFIKTIVKRDFDTYSGRLLEKFFMELFQDTKQFNRIGTYWEKGHKNEIDIVAINELEQSVVLAEVKTNSRRNSQSRLEHRAIKLLKQYPTYQVEYKCLSLQNANNYLEKIKL